MAAYIDSAYVDAWFGENVRSALFTDDEGEYDSALFATQVAGASALVASYARNAGYTIATDQQGLATEDLVKLATLGELLKSAYFRPDKRVPMPDGIERHPAMIAAEGIRTGDTPFVQTDPNELAAVGGWSFTPSDPNVDGSVPRRTSRREMDGF